MERMDVLRALARQRTDEIVITTMTTTLQWPLVSSHPLDFDFLAFGMGHASDFGLGLALARPERKVIVLKGDGGLLMSLGSLVTMARYGPENLLVLLFENGAYEMTGGQRLSPLVDFVTLARGAGMENVERIEDLGAFVEALPTILHSPGPRFVILAETNSEALPRVAHTDHTTRVTNLRAALGVGT
jgi:thiamine pyrophosphate-dependent acetolactate synthase large subunit-like protein